MSTEKFSLMAIMLYFCIGCSAICWGEERTIDDPKAYQVERNSPQIFKHLVNEQENIEKSLYQELLKRQADFSMLLEAKYHLISGNIEKAEFFLKRFSPKRKEMELLKNRYLAIIAFIKDDYVGMLDYLQDGIYNNLAYYPHICLMKSLGEMTLRQRKAFKNEFSLCSPLTSRFSRNDQLWYESLAKLFERNYSTLKGGDLDTISKSLEDNEIIRPWLKLALYSNRESMIIPLISRIPGNAYHSHSVRELLGLIYYRLGEESKALEFIDDLSGPNAENIKGNIDLLKGRDELAFGHFKLALQKKENSLNAVERALPLSWKLGQWKEGLSLLARIVDRQTDIKKKLSLNTAFQIRMNNFHRAFDQLKELRYYFKNESPKEVAQMHAYTAFMVNNKEEGLKNANIACRKNDGLMCYAEMELSIWEDLTKTIARDEEIYTDKEITMDNLKAVAEITPMHEEHLIDQRDIEELDSSLLGIELTKTQ